MAKDAKGHGSDAHSSGVNAIPQPQARQSLEYGKQQTKPGSNARTINVSQGGQPFGQLWTFRNTATDTHPWHAKPLNGPHAAFYKEDGGLNAAKAHMEKFKK